MVLTDINNTSACLNFIRLAPQYGVKPIVGVDFRNNATQQFVMLAENNIGFENINHLLSFYKHNKIEIPDLAPSTEQVKIIYPFEKIEKMQKTNFAENEYIGLNIWDMNRWRFSLWKKNIDRCVILQTFTFRNKSDYNTHRLLRAIDNNTLLSKLPTLEQANYERDKFYSQKEIEKYFGDFPQLIFNTKKLQEQCNIYFDFSVQRPAQNKKLYSQSIQEDRNLLYYLCEQALPKRYKNINTIVKDRLQKELALIEKMNFIPFFLINWDIVKFASEQNFYHVGRGSGANSIVAYLLGITDVDPIALDLYFERFMNLYRTSPPDFDIDFSTKDRPVITKYIFDRFGKNGQVALLGAYNTFQYSAAVRELGKVFGLPKMEIDKLSDGKYQLDNLDKISSTIIQYAKRFHNMPNYLTVHSAGIVISEPHIHYFSATEMPPKGFPTLQFDMHIAEDVGLFKFDILGQRGLGKIKDSLEIIKYNQPQAATIDIHDAEKFMLDEKVNDTIRQSKCIGCFYVESPAMRTLIKKLKVDNYLSLVAASSIIRPGVSQSGMMREYILRHKNPERRKDAHPVLMQIMPETYGIMVYQEDVIKVAHLFAGLDLGEADVLRRGMSGKFRSREEFSKVQEKFISNCKQKGYEDKIINEVWSQIESFAGYAFAKGHSASYAVESYQSIFLKTYYPLEFMVAVINNGGGFYNTENYVHEARMLGANIEAPCIRNSNWETIIKGKTIYLGFQHILSIEKNIIKKILQERDTGGSFLNYEDFKERIYVPFEQLDLLIRIDAFRLTNTNKRNLLWDALVHARFGEENESQSKMFTSNYKKYSLPELPISDIEKAFDQIELLGFALCDPFLLVKNEAQFSKIVVADMQHFINKEFEIYAYLVTIKNTHTHLKKERMHFGTFVDRAGAWLDTVHFPIVSAQYPFRGKGVYYLKGIVKEEFEVLSLEIFYMKKMPNMEDPRYEG